jgi:hypothetical protein
MSKLKLVLAALAAAATFSAQAALVVYTGADDNVSSLAQMTNSVAAATQFDLDNLGFETVIDFESALPAGVSISGGTTTNNSGCGQLCGFNTTLGGSFFRNLFGGSVTFNFAFPIDDFGFYITGLQTNLVPQETLTFSDGSTQTINTPAAINGGGAFIGFTDFGKSIVSVTYNATNDIVSIDDVRFSIAAVPEPASLALVGIAALAMGAWRRRRS